MTVRRLFIANRAEIAVRIARAADELGLESVGVYSTDDDRALHTQVATKAIALPGAGPKAYLDAEAMVRLAVETACDAVHPGYGFLSENAAFARRCQEAGLTFVGPSPHVLDLFGDKLKAKALALKTGVPTLAGPSEIADEANAEAYFRSLGPSGALMVKAVAGGGGRGVRIVRQASDLKAAIAACRAEALSAFGVADVYVERFIASARHIEVQIVGDRFGELVQLGERDCTAQRRHQKILEVAPAADLASSLRDRMLKAAVRLGRAGAYDNVGTIEFLVDREASPDDPDAFAFIEANPRLQVEHTVTEEVYGIDLVKTQIHLADGAAVSTLDLGRRHSSRGCAIQLRINAETLNADAEAVASSGVLIAFNPPSGPGVRVDTAGYVGYRVNPRFDSLLAKLIVWSEDQQSAIRKAARALSEFRIEGVATNRGLLAALLEGRQVATGDLDTGWIERHAAELTAAVPPRPRYFSDDPSALGPTAFEAGPPGAIAATAPMAALLVSLEVRAGDLVRQGQSLAIFEAMKMQHLVEAPCTGVILDILVQAGQVLDEGQPLFFIDPVADEETEVGLEDRSEAADIRPDLMEVYDRHALTLDENRPEAVARRRKLNKRTARENLGDLFDPDSFVEYGALAIAAQRRRRTVEDLMQATPADGLVGGVGTVNAADFGEEGAKCMGISYDYTVLAGTQGHINHKKTDRLLAVAERLSLPIVFFTEGGGGRPGDVDAVGVSGLDTHTFYAFAKLSGVAPRIGVASGRCFAGNAVLLGCCDVVVATRDSNIGLGGPAMIEGGGLGVFAPEDIGPIDVQSKNGVVDVVVEDEAEAVRSAKSILAYFQGRLECGEVADQRLLRSAIPPNRLRVYDVRKVIGLIADVGSFSELRQGFAAGMVTGLVRVGGRPMGLIANDCRHLGGAIDSEGADKAARFMQLCDAFGLPILSLCDTPGFMVGPEAEKTGAVRHGSRMFLVAAALSSPIFTVVLRKGYGLGAQAMAGGSFHTTAFTISWPTGEFGGMGLEGAVRLGYRKELEAVVDLEARQALFDKHVRNSYARGKAVSVAQFIEIDAVIDPVDTRTWILRGLASTPSPSRRVPSRYIDAW